MEMKQIHFVSLLKDFWKVIRVKDAESIKLVTDYPDASDSF